MKKYFIIKTITRNRSCYPPFIVSTPEMFIPTFYPNITHIFICFQLFLLCVCLYIFVYFQRFTSYMIIYHVCIFYSSVLITSNNFLLNKYFTFFLFVYNFLRNFVHIFYIYCVRYMLQANDKITNSYSFIDNNLVTKLFSN